MPPFAAPAKFDYISFWGQAFRLTSEAARCNDSPIISATHRRRCFFLDIFILSLGARQRPVGAKLDTISRFGQISRASIDKSQDGSGALSMSP